MDDRLFSPCPATRLAAAVSLSEEAKDQILKSYQPGTVRDRGAANAWVVVVGPSYGAPKKRKYPSLWSPQSANYLTLGKVHEDFNKLLEEDSVFWRSLFGILEVGFEKRIKGISTENQEHLKVALTTNLTPGHEGEEARLVVDELAAGMSRFWHLLGFCKPRVVVALTETVREMILDYAQITGLGKRLTGDDLHHVDTRDKHYTSRSCWLNVKGGGEILLVSLPQHPSRAAVFGGSYVRSVGAYLGRRFRDALSASDLQCSQPALCVKPSPDSAPITQATA